MNSDLWTIHTLSFSVVFKKNLRLPRLPGISCLWHIRKKNPHCPVILAQSYCHLANIVDQRFPGTNVTHWEARHPLEARHDPCRRWQYLFSKYLTPSTVYRVTNTIKKKRTTVRINLCALDQLFYLYLVVITDCLGHP